jgi:hypothetical protein
MSPPQRQKGVGIPGEGGGSFSGFPDQPSKSRHCRFSTRVARTAKLNDRGIWESMAIAVWVLVLKKYADSGRQRSKRNSRPVKLRLNQSVNTSSYRNRRKSCRCNAARTSRTSRRTSRPVIDRPNDDHPQMPDFCPSRLWLQGSVSVILAVAGHADLKEKSRQTQYDRRLTASRENTPGPALTPKTWAPEAFRIAFETDDLLIG